MKIAREFMKFIAENAGTIIFIALISMCMWSDCMRAVEASNVPNVRAGSACEAICGHGKVRSVSVSSCVCK